MNLQLIYPFTTTYSYLHITFAFSHPPARMRNRDQYRKAIVGLPGLAEEESKMHTFSRIQWIIFSEKYLCKI